MLFSFQEYTHVKLRIVFSEVRTLTYKKAKVSKLLLTKSPKLTLLEYLARSVKQNASLSLSLSLSLSICKYISHTLPLLAPFCRSLYLSISPSLSLSLSLSLFVFCLLTHFLSLYIYLNGSIFSIFAFLLFSIGRN